MMKKPILSLPIDDQLDTYIQQDAREEHLSRADIVRRILRLHYARLIRRREVGLQKTHRTNGRSR